MPGVQLPIGIDTLNPVDANYKIGPWNTIADALSGINIAVRFNNMFFYVKNDPLIYYWLDTDLTDGGLLTRISGSSLPSMIGNNGKILTTNSTTAFWQTILTILGYTPVNKSGDTMLGNLILNADAVSSLGAVTLQQLQSYVTGLWDDRGNYNASTNLFPSTGGSGSGGAILKGDIWTVSVIGTLGGVSVALGDTVRALVDTPNQISTNWAIASKGLGYTPLSNALNSTQIFVGSAGNIAVGVVFSGDGTISNLGVFTLNNVSAVKGGTGQTVYAIGDILYAATTTTLAKRAAVVVGNALISAGVGVAPVWGKIGLTTHVIGILPIANGGTNNTTFTNGKYIFFDGTKLANSNFLSESTLLGIYSLTFNSTGTNRTRLIGRANSTGAEAEIVTFGGTDSGGSFGSYLKFNFLTGLITFGSDSAPDAVTIDMNSGVITGAMTPTTLDVSGVATFYDTGTQQFVGSVFIQTDLAVQGNVTYGRIILLGVIGQPMLNVAASGRSLISSPIAGSLEVDDGTNSVYYTSGDGIRRRLQYREPVGLTQASAPSHTPQPQWDYFSCTTLTTSLSFLNPTFTPKNFQSYKIRLKSAIMQTLTWSAFYVQMGAALPLMTVSGKTMNIVFEYDSVVGKYGCISVFTEL